WQLLGQQVLMGKMNLPAEVLGAKDFSSLPPILGELAELKAGMLRGAQLTTEQQQRVASVTPYNLDAWDGYPVEREMLYGMARQQGKQLVVLAGDTHNAWHSSLLDQEGHHVGVELATPSVSSPGMETYFGTTGEQALQLADALTVLVDDLHYCNLHQRGYLVLTVTAQALEADWRFVDTVTEREYRAVDAHRQMIPAW
ncbi:MAG TPA: alkaline phosphatase D family protein, partial [Kineobactrum sp.]